MKIAAIVEARMNSTRLPGKHLLRVGNNTMFEVLIDQLRYSRNISEIILATTINKSDDCLAQIATNLGLTVYRGDEDNVYQRVVGAALTNAVDLIVEITADCPLIDPTIIDAAVKYYLDGDFDYVSNCVNRVYPDGMDVQVYSSELLRSSCINIKDKKWLEHVTIQFRNNEGRQTYKIFDLPMPPYGDKSELEVTLDEPDDFLLICEIYNELKVAGKYIACQEIIRLLADDTRLRSINENVMRKSDLY